MNFSRRTFLGSLGAAFALRRMAALAEERPLLRFGVLSDPHIRVDPASAEPLRKAFARFHREGVRVVVICGDVCHDGTLRELRNVADAWKASFPNGKNANGETVEPFFVWGNHDYHDASYMKGKAMSEEDVRLSILCNKDKAWEMLTGRPHPGEIFLHAVNGVTFVGAHWRHFDAELKPWLDAHKAEIPADRPVFFVQHSHPRRTCFGKWYSGSSGENLATLMEHPNFFVMSGHSHISCSYDDAIWQGGFCSMAAGCMQSGGPRRYEYNVGVPKKDPRPCHMPGQNPGGAQQASIVTVWPSRVLVTRWDHRHDERIGEDWDIPFPFVHDAKSPWRIAAAAEAPEFPAGAAVSVERKAGLLYPTMAKEAQVHLTFPAASSVGPHSRVIDYDVVVTRAADGAKVAERLVAQRGLSLSEARARTFGGWCVFGADELPAGERLVFTVTPLNAGGKSGKSLVKEIVL